MKDNIPFARESPFMDKKAELLITWFLPSNCITLNPTKTSRNALGERVENPENVVHCLANLFYRIQCKQTSQAGKVI